MLRRSLRRTLTVKVTFKITIEIQENFAIKTARAYRFKVLQ